MGVELLMTVWFALNERVGRISDSVIRRSSAIRRRLTPSANPPYSSTSWLPKARQLTQKGQGCGSSFADGYVSELLGEICQSAKDESNESLSPNPGGLQQPLSGTQFGQALFLVVGIIIVIGLLDCLFFSLFAQNNFLVYFDVRRPNPRRISVPRGKGEESASTHIREARSSRSAHGDKKDGLRLRPRRRLLIDMRWTTQCHPALHACPRELNRKRLSQPDPDRISLKAARPGSPVGWMERPLRLGTDAIALPLFWSVPSPMMTPQ
jgi:hypothetical protein